MAYTEDDYYGYDGGTGDTTIYWVEDECAECEHVFSEDVDASIVKGDIIYEWTCPDCGEENEFRRRFD